MAKLSLSICPYYFIVLGFLDKIFYLFLGSLPLYGGNKHNLVQAQWLDFMSCSCPTQTKKGTRRCKMYLQCLLFY